LCTEGKGHGGRRDTKGLTYIHVYACRLVQVNAPRSALPGVLTAEKRALVQGQQSPMHATPPDGDGGGKGAKMSATKKRILFLLSLLHSATIAGKRTAVCGFPLDQKFYYIERKFNFSLYQIKIYFKKRQLIL